MAFNAGSIVAYLKLDKKTFDAAMLSAKKQTEGFSKSYRVSQADFTKLWIASSAAVAGTAYALKKAVDAAADAQRAEMGLAQAMKLRGVYTEESFRQNIDYAQALQNTLGIENEQINFIQESLIRRGAQGEMLKKLTLATLDFATAQKKEGMDATSAGAMIGKTLTSEINLLGRWGITVTGAAGSTERMQSVVEGITQLFGGRALSAAQGYAGQQEILRLKIADLEKEVGKRLMPSFEGLQIAITDCLDPISSFTTESWLMDDTIKGINFDLQWGVKTVFGVGAALDITSGIIARTGDNFYKMGVIAADVWKVLRAPNKNSLISAFEALKTDFSDINWSVGLGPDIEKWAGQLDKIDEAFSKSKNKRNITDNTQQSLLPGVDIEAETNTWKNAQDVIAGVYDSLKSDDLSLDWSTQIDLMHEFDDLMPDMAAQVQGWAADTYDSLQAPAAAITQLRATVQSFYDYKNVQLENSKNKEIKAATEEYNNKKKWITENIADETERSKQLGELEEGFQAQKSNIEDTYRQKELDARRAMKPLLIAEAIANTALGVTKALASGFPPWNFIQAGLVSAAGAFQVATIKAQEFARGGEMPYTGTAIVGERGPEIIDLPAGARVHNNQETKQLLRDTEGKPIAIINVGFLDIDSVSDYSLQKVAASLQPHLDYLKKR
jgi:hypothetical protein